MSEGGREEGREGEWEGERESGRVREEGARPAKANATCSSKRHIFLTVLTSCNFARARFSTASTTVSSPRTATWVWVRNN